MSSRKRPPASEAEAVTAYIEAAGEPGRSRLQGLREVIRQEVPAAIERMAYGLPTWFAGENVLHLGVFAHHVGVYPGAAAIEAFARDLEGYRTSKGAIQFPHDGPIPTDLIRRITRWRVEHIAAGERSVAPSVSSRARTRASRVASRYPKVEVFSRADLRAWLAAEHQRSRGAWIVAWKKHTGSRHVDASAIAEEALCFGWIDSLPRALDADRSMLLVTPRKPASAWSRVNKERVARLIANGDMAQAGLAVVEAAKESGAWEALDAVEDLACPPDLLERFQVAPPEAWGHFDAFPRSVKRGILEWIHGAKRPETRSRRIEETVVRAAKNERANQWRP